MIRRALRRIAQRFMASPATGGGIQGPSPSDDSIPALLSPGYVSYDRGESWREYGAEAGGTTP